MKERVFEQSMGDASLAVEAQGFEKLLDLLAAEQEALRSADADALAQIVPQKVAQVHALRRLADARMRDLVHEGFVATAAGMREFLARSAESTREQWLALVRLAAEAQRINALNMRLANAQQRHVDQAMATLCRAAGRDTTYGADGRSRHHAPSRTLAAI
jgi:flagellar biosynthesis/type III secretory pathway chaperone